MDVCNQVDNALSNGLIAHCRKRIDYHRRMPKLPHEIMALAMERAHINPSHLGRLCSTSRQQIYLLSKGERTITIAWAKRLAPHLGLTWMQLLGEAPLGFAEDSAAIEGAPSAPEDEAADIEHRATIAEAVVRMLRDANAPTDMRSIVFVTDQVREAILKIGPIQPFEDRLANAISERREALRRKWEKAISE
jgi:plasmid maintenance system antidote protein VapI